jgi:hypothetical protein
MDIRSHYEEARRQRTELPAWDELGDDIVFALLHAYRAGTLEGWTAAKQPARSGKDLRAVPDALSCPIGSTPQREALFRKMFDAVICELVPPDGVMEDMFKDLHPYTVRMATADLAASLLTHAVDDCDIDDLVWAGLVDEIRNEMRASILAQEGAVPYPTWQ